MYKGRVFALEEHVERLINSCRALMFEDIPEPDNIKNAVIPPPSPPPIFFSIFYVLRRNACGSGHQKRRKIFFVCPLFFSVFLFFVVI